MTSVTDYSAAVQAAVLSLDLFHSLVGADVLQPWLLLRQRFDGLGRPCKAVGSLWGVGFDGSERQCVCVSTTGQASMAFCGRLRASSAWSFLGGLE